MSFWCLLGDSWWTSRILFRLLVFLNPIYALSSLIGNIVLRALLTLAGIGGPSVELRGPSDLDSLVQAMKSFIPHAFIHAKSFGNLPYPDTITISEGHFFVCERADVKISAILLQPRFSEDISVKPSDTSVVYICELAEIKGKFHNDKAEKLGLKPGPKRQQLLNGKSVKSDSLDLLVNPSDVIDPPIQGPVVLIVDCPTESHAEKLSTTQSLRKYYVKLSDEAPPIVNCVVHLTPTSVVNNTNYQSWMKNFGSTNHIMAGYSMKNISIPILESSSRIMNQLNYLCPQFFPAPLQSIQHHFDADIDMVCNENICNNVLAENLLKFTLLSYHHLGLDKSNVPDIISPSQVFNDLLLEIPEVLEASKQIRQLECEVKEVEGCDSTRYSAGPIGGPISDENPLPSCLEDIRRDDAEIVFLGMGSSHPSKYRNVSSIFINLFFKGCLLLDCGEGTLAQLKRRYGMEAAANAVKNLRFIWISHIHADHLSENTCSKA